jgi:hypothetical protein
LTLFLEKIMNLMLHRLILLDFHFLRLTQRHYRKALLRDNPMFFFITFFFLFESWKLLLL